MAGTVERTLALKLIGDVGSIGKDLKGVSTGIDKADRKARGFKGTIANVGSGLASWGKAFTGALVVDGIEGVTSALGDAWAGFRSGQQVAGQLEQTWKNLGIRGASFSKTLDSVATSANLLGMSDDEAVTAFDHLLQATGNVHESMKRLRIAQNLVANGSAPNLDSALRIIQGAAKGSARVVDRFGLTAKTAGGRIGQLGRHVHNAAKRKAELDPLGTLFTVMSGDLEDIVGNLGSGNIDEGIEAMATAGDHLADAWARVKANNPDFIGPGTALGEALNGIAAAAERVAPLVDAVTTAVGAAGSAFNEILGPAMQQVHDGPLADLISAFGAPVVGALNFSLQAATLLIQEVGDALNGDFSKAIHDAGAGLQAMADTVTAAFRATVGAIGELMGGIVTAWNNLDFNIPAGSFQFTPAQHIPNPFGGFFDIPAVGFNWDGTGDLIPDFAQGGIVRHRPGGMLARIGEGGRDEAVVPLGRGGGMGNVTINLYGIAADEPSVGRALNRALAAYEQRGGRIGVRS